MLNRFWISFVLFVAIPAVARCHDPRLRSAVVHGNVLNGTVLNHKKPVKFAQVRLSLDGKLINTSSTDKDGIFSMPGLTPNKYELSLLGWDSVPVEILPTQLKHGQVVYDSLMLFRDGKETCVGVTSIMN